MAESPILILIVVLVTALAALLLGIAWRMGRGSAATIMELKRETLDLRRQIFDDRRGVDAELARFVDHLRLEVHALATRMSGLERQVDDQYDALENDVEDLTRKLERRGAQPDFSPAIREMLRALRCDLDGLGATVGEIKALAPAATAPAASGHHRLADYPGESATRKIEDAGQGAVAKIPLRDWINQNAPVGKSSNDQPLDDHAAEPLPWNKLRIA